MAYQQQQHNNYPPQQQYYNQGPPAPSQGRQNPGHSNNNYQYNEQYDGYGYDQGQYEQWDDGYYDQQQAYRQQEDQQGGWNNRNVNEQRPPPREQYPPAPPNGVPNGQMRPPQGRGQPVTRDQYGPASGVNGGGGMKRGDPRGRGNGRGQNIEQGRGGLRPPGADRAQISPVSPRNLPQDSPFPTFPAQQAKPRPKNDSLEEAMALMNIGHENPPQGDRSGPPQGRGRGAGRGQGPPPPNWQPQGRRQDNGPDLRHDSGHLEGHGYGQNYPIDQGYGQRKPPPPVNFEGRRGPPPRQQQQQQQQQPLHQLYDHSYDEGRQGPPPRQQQQQHFDHHDQSYDDGRRRPPPRQQQQQFDQQYDQHYDQRAPTQESFEPHLQRSQTMPQNASGGMSGVSYGAQEGWAEPGPVAGYHGPESAAYVPPRPSTAGGIRPNGGNKHIEQRRPPMPQVAPSQGPVLPQGPARHQQQNPQDEGLDNFYDDYYGGDDKPGRESKASLDMPDFDAIPDNSGRHRRGDSIENHLSPASGPAPAQSTTLTVASPADVPGAPKGNFPQQAARSRSQPDLHEHYQQESVYEMAGDAPPVPQLPRSNTNFSVPMGLPSGPRSGMPPARGGMHTNPAAGRLPPQGYPGGPSPIDPRYGRQQPSMQRGFSEESQWSDPGVQGMRQGTPMAGTPIQRPGTAAPGPVPFRPGTAAPGPMPVRHPSDPVHQRPGTTQPQRSNPDALPAHPTPVRPGHMQQQQSAASPPPARPQPTRHYNTDPNPVGHAAQQVSSGGQEQRRASAPHPVTYDELNRLRNTWKVNPNDHATGLLLAKKLVEAVGVLADEGGTADTRTRNKNREKFIFEAHKTVKKLVSGGSTEAMFYLADCYGQGQLGLQVDTKEAFSLYQSAAKAGHAAAAYRTAVCCEMGHEDGGGTKKDPLKAVQWYRRAAALGDPAAMYKMGMILLKGLLGQNKNLGEAINMLKRAADRADEDNPHALHELALLYQAPTGNERIIPDEAYAFSLFENAAKFGYKFSQFRLGQAYEYGQLGCPIDPRSSIAWYTRAAAQEEHQSELALSGWYLTGAQGILDQSDTEAYLWARKAACAEPPLAKALFAMGYFSETGIGCPRSLEEAKRWYGRAAAYKFPKAQQRLEELKKGGSKAQRSRERLSRTNQRQHEENCVVM